MEQYIADKLPFIKIVQSDNGGEFKNELIATFFENHPHIRHIFSSPRKPRSNGGVESVNKTLKRVLRHLQRQLKKAKHRKWHKLLGQVDGESLPCR